MSYHSSYHTPHFRRVDNNVFFAYTAAGCCTAVADFGSFTTTFSIFKLDLFTATVIAYVTATATSYALNRYWVFRHGPKRETDSKILLRYFTFLLFNLSITYILLAAMNSWFHLTPYLGKVITGMVMFFWIYLGDKFWVFKEETKEGPVELA